MSLGGRNQGRMEKDGWLWQPPVTGTLPRVQGVLAPAAARDLLLLSRSKVKHAGFAMGGGLSRRSERGGSLPAVRGRIDSPGPPHAHTADGQRGRAAGRWESGSSILCLSPGAFPLPV